MKKQFMITVGAALPLLMTGCIHVADSSGGWNGDHHRNLQSFSHSTVIDGHDQSNVQEATEACIKFLKSSALNGRKSFDIVSQKTKITESKSGQLIAECSMKIKS